MTSSLAVDFAAKILILIFSIIIHEISHGSMANYLGDPTAKNAGRLTLNPLKHLDPVGSVFVPIFLFLTTGSGFGWARPVPINPFNFKNPKKDSFKVALAGPGSNLAVALFFGLILRFALGSIPQNLVLIFAFIVSVNILLAVFNLIPIPPLDGSHIFFAFLPRSWQGLQVFLSQFGFIILLFLIFVVPQFFQFLIYILDLFFYLIVGLKY